MIMIPQGAAGADFVRTQPPQEKEGGGISAVEVLILRISKLDFVSMLGRLLGSQAVSMAVRLKIINFIRIRARRLGVSFGLGNSYVRFIIIRIKSSPFLFWPSFGRINNFSTEGPAHRRMVGRK